MFALIFFPFQLMQVLICSRDGSVYSLDVVSFETQHPLILWTLWAVSNLTQWRKVYVSA